jgi:hypothetical protein
MKTSGRRVGSGVRLSGGCPTAAVSRRGNEYFLGACSCLTLAKITSYADIRSVATKSNVLSSISKISRTLPLAILFNPQDEGSIVVTT